MRQREKEKDLIRKLLNGTCSRNELEDINQLLSKPHAQQLFDEVLAEQDEVLEPDHEIDSDYLNDRLAVFYKKNNELSPKRQPIRMGSLRKFYRYAAVLVLGACGLGAYWYATRSVPAQNSSLAVNRQRVQWLSHHNERGQRARITLSDQSVVYLGPGSTLEYPAAFTDSSRTVKLSGEAFFDVKSHPRQPFMVQAGDTRTRVLGTSFKIMAFPGLALEVAVTTGKVQVEHMQDERPLAIMAAGDQISWRGGQVEKGRIHPEEVLAWTEQQFIFRKTSLKEILDVLERNYNLDIVCKKEQVAAEKVSVTLDGRVPLERTMAVLAATAGFTYHKTNAGIIIN